MARTSRRVVGPREALFGRVTLCAHGTLAGNGCVLPPVRSSRCAGAALRRLPRRNGSFRRSCWTAVFAIYALAPLVTLLIFGSVSRPSGAPSGNQRGALRERGRLCPFPDGPRSRTAVRGAGGTGGRRWPGNECARGDVDRPATRGQRSRSRFHERRPVVGLGRRRARGERVGAIRASADASRLVVAARHIFRRRARDPDAARDVSRTFERLRLTASERGHPTPGSLYAPRGPHRSSARHGP